ncbi:MAG: hypothetical protein LBR52_02460 [Prevotellaceae bacterium]|jgi:hypothetical protein|nr:hypothetical protein [Prevotellaceae bacterium]
MGIAELFLSVEKKRAAKEGEKCTIKRTIINMLNKNLDDDLIAGIAGVSLDYVAKLKLSLNK